MNQTIEPLESSGRSGDTKDRILDAAEKLFAENGFQATSLRQITSEAGVNLAAVNYHFQSKESLILAVLSRKLEPINRRRIELLNELEAESGGAPLKLEAVLSAFLVPVFEARAAGVVLCTFPKLLGRVYTEPGDWMEKIMPAAFGGVVKRFRSAFEGALPGMDPVDVAWGIHFSIGSMAHYLAAGRLLDMISMGQADPTDTGGAMERLVVYMAGGLRAMAWKRIKEAGR